MFRGRYKAILINTDNYLLPLSRYVHRNPVETKQPLVKELEKYTWSSYPAYLGKTPAPSWLCRNQVYDALGKRNKYQAYGNYVALGVDEELVDFYDKGKMPSVLGDKSFREKALDKNEVDLAAKDKAKVLTRPSMKQVIAATAKVLGTSIDSIEKPQKGRQQRTPPRKIAMYLSQALSGASLQEVADNFGVSHRGGVSNALTEVRKLEVCEKKIAKEIKLIIEVIQLS